MLFLFITDVLRSAFCFSDLVAAGARQSERCICQFNLPWLVGIAGLLFLPWTILMYTIVFPLNGWDWLWIGLAVACDIFTYTGGMYKRKSVPYYPETAP